MYGLKTSHFYSKHEARLDKKIHVLRSEKNYIINQIPSIKKEIAQSENAEEIENLENKIVFIKYLAKMKSDRATQTKKELNDFIANKSNRNIKTEGKDHIRVLKEDSLHDTDVVSVFDSALTRTIEIEQDTLTDELMIVKIFYKEIFRDICRFGFEFKGQKYIYLTSSAGQIRTKKAVFIKEDTYKEIEKTLMCGLTIDKINSKGGNNVNKHLAYLALTNSATDLWEDFDIRKTIVIDDFETNVNGEVDFINDDTFTIERQTIDVPIPHTDGAGMVLPSLLDRNSMFRAPWIKGLIGSFDFRKFIEVNNCSHKITDIYGKTYDIFEDDIQIIFTKSQFKMWKYYDSWAEYQLEYEENNCTAGLCNTEEDRFKNAKINYQMLQTLTDITDKEIDMLVEKSKTRIEKLCTSQKTMLEALGVTTYSNCKSKFQKALSIYPALLNDTYAKDVLRSMKNSLLKKYRGGKLEISGKYTFLMPDFYAACEYWFLGIKEPLGLLQNKEVYCRLFRKSPKLDCLRSPHLFKEHAVRNNVIIDEDRDRIISEWFQTDAIYTSTHDMISKILQFDVDGDKSLVVSNPTFVEIAERNMKGVVPLYYNMRKAEPSELNPDNIYKGLDKAFNGSNIGEISNAISKVWNSEIFISGTEEEKQEAMDVIKLLCMKNNFVIDYAKTLYKPDTPKWANELIKKYTKAKLPAYFEFAKDKEKSQVEKRNNTVVNTIYKKIKDKQINTRKLDIEKIDYTKLMSNVNNKCTLEVAEKYNELNRQYRFKIDMKDEYEDNLHFIACEIRDEMSKLGYSDDVLSDMLVEYLYDDSKVGENAHEDKILENKVNATIRTKKAQSHKHVLWFCYGNIIVNNLKRNIETKKTKWIECVDCGEWVEVGEQATAICRCEVCQIMYRKNYQKELMSKKRKGKC